MIKRIALHVEKDSGCKARTLAAAGLARQFEAELVGVYVGDMPLQYFADGVTVPDNVYRMLLRDYDEARRQAQDEFLAQARHAGVPAQWRAPEGNPADVLAVHARCTDLLVISQAGEQLSDSVIAPHLTASIIMTSGRPVLVVPNAGEFPRIGRRILFCWDHGREAARALADAAPFLTRAESVVALTLDPSSVELRRRQTVEGDLQAYFLAHGYAAPKVETRDTQGVGMGNSILNAAADHGCDLIVMGLYGHSRAREWVMGGASRTMLASMTAPVLFSH